MPDVQLLYALTGAFVFAVGLGGVLFRRTLLGQIIAFNVSGVGLFLALVAIAYRGAATPPDAVLHALVLTGIVVAVSATAFALALARRVQGEGDE